MRVLGIDPGLTRCGLGVVDGVPGRQPLLVAFDVIRTPVELDIARRLLAIEENIRIAKAWSKTMIDHKHCVTFFNQTLGPFTGIY